MDKKESEQALSTLKELSNLLSEKRAQYAQNLALLATTLLGILVTLRCTASPELWLRWVFAVLILSLVSGIGAMQLAVFGEQTAIADARKMYLAESLSAVANDHPVRPVASKERPIFAVAYRIGYGSLALSLVLLSVYGIALSF